MNETPQKVCFYLPSLKGGGAERVIVRVANEFAKRGYVTEIAVVDRKGPYLDDVADAVTVVDLDTHRFLAAIPSLVKYLRTARPDVILSTIDSANVAAIVAKHLSGVRARVVVRISNTISAKSKKLSNPKHQIVHFAAKQAYPYADHTIGVSHGVTKDTITQLELSDSLATTIYNPVVEDRFHEDSKEPVSHPWFQEDSPPVVLGVGELSEQKDFSTLIRAFAKVDLDPQPRLVILGSGDKLTELEELATHLGIGSRVDFPGFVDNPYAFMAKTDLFVLSSQWEGCPNVLIEAMACGAPVLATDCPSGPREILQDGKFGTLVPVGDIDYMSNEIENLLSSKPDIEASRQRGLSFDIPTIADKYESVLIDGDTIFDEHV